MNRAEGFLCQGVTLGHQPGNAKISNLNRAVFQHHHIMGLNIPVDNTAAVGVFQSLCDLNCKMQGLLPVQHTLFLHVLLQGDSLDQLHNNVICLHRDGSGHIVNRYDIRMGQHSNSLTFRMEPAAEILILQKIVFEYFNRYQTVKPVTASLIYNCHTAGSDHFQNLIPVVKQTANIFIHHNRKLLSGLDFYQNAGHIIRCAPAFCNIHKRLTADLLIRAVDHFKQNFLIV